MKAILIRVGADTTSGGGRWLAPADPHSGRFVYIPIPERPTTFRAGCERRFDEVSGHLLSFLAECRADDGYWRRRLSARSDAPMHLDPDYEHLTYGDRGSVRGRDLRLFERDDVIVFYSAFRPVRPARDLIYAVVGLFVIDEVLPARSVEESRRSENAHTRKAEPALDDIVVRARAGVSGRCTRFIPIGEKRGISNYYLRPEIEQAWGGLVGASGTPRKSSWLNMSGVLPLLGDPAGFMRWWAEQRVGLVQTNFAA